MIVFVYVVIDSFNVVFFDEIYVVYIEGVKEIFVILLECGGGGY